MQAPAANGGGLKTCHGCGQPGHLKRECPDAVHGGEDQRVCHNCNQTGHIRRDCPSGYEKVRHFDDGGAAPADSEVLISSRT